MHKYVAADRLEYLKTQEYMCRMNNEALENLKYEEVGVEKKPQKVMSFGELAGIRGVGITKVKKNG
jgi:hypothetical protein